MKYLTTFFILLLLLFIKENTAQCNGRYQNEIFSSVSVSTVNYSDVFTDQYHEMDIYTPDGDTVTDRPVIIYTHGGSFYGGDKNLTDCVDFCNYFAKRGYVTISANYRLSSNPIIFALNQEEQYKTVLKAVADIKSAVRYLRKDHTQGNSLGINPNGIYVGGYSAGGVLAVHLAYIDDITDLPTSPIDVQGLVSTIGGDLEGDAGNDGYSSDIHGVISFAGGINDISWINANDEPLVSIQGDNDQTVNFNCGPGLNQPTVLTLCGTNEMHPRADSVGIINDYVVYPGEGHTWAAGGNADTLFTYAMEFTSDFLYPILPCNNPSAGIKVNRITLNQFPNPANQWVNYVSSQTIDNIRVYNWVGQTIKEIQVNSNNYVLNVTDLSKGIYSVIVNLNNKDKVYKKLMLSE